MTELDYTDKKDKHNVCPFFVIVFHLLRKDILFFP